MDSYAKHAYVWDWDGYDNTPEYEYWCEYAGKYGTKVLTPMCALGSVGAYMAQQGFEVLGFDLTEEMIEEGKKRFGYLENLELVVADICDFDFSNKIFDFAFIKDQDLHLLSGMDEVRRALSCLHGALRQGGGLVLELTLPFRKSSHSPKQIFYPRVPNFTDKRIWKESECRYDAAEGRNYINQTVFVEKNGVVESFEYVICLQYFLREEVLRALCECGFKVVGEYSDRSGRIWDGEEGYWCVEAMKR